MFSTATVLTALLFCLLATSSTQHKQQHNAMAAEQHPQEAHPHHHDWHESADRPSSKATRVLVIGAGAYGSGLAIHCARAGHTTTLWCRSPEVAEEINIKHTNSRRLPGFAFPASLKASSEALPTLLQSTAPRLVLLVVPSSHIAATVQQFIQHLPVDAALVCCAKGITTDTLQTMDEVLLGVVPAAQHRQLAFLSGPSFAAEVAEGKPTGLTIAARDEAVAKQVQWWLSAANLRCYRTTDVVGIELGGALKNVFAIGCGLADGKEYGSNGRAMIITRGLYEMTRLAVAKGANPLTLAGLAGVGDLVLTCTGDASRNRSLGFRLGRGETMQQITESMHGAVAEGVATTKAAKLLADKLGVFTPIIQGLYRMLFEGEDPDDVVSGLLCLPLTPELDADSFSFEAPSDAAPEGAAS